MSPVEIIVAILLGAVVLVQWLCCLGLCFMRNSFDQLHAIAPAGILPPLLIGITFTIENGWSIFATKAFFIAVVLIFTQATIIHALGRAAQTRKE